MANPSGGTFHYSQKKLNQPGYPGIVRDDGTRAEPAANGGLFGGAWASDLAGSVGNTMRNHPLPAFLGAMALGYVAGCLLSEN